MTIRDGIPVRAARLALDEAIQQIHRSIHPGDICGNSGADGESIAKAAGAYALRIQAAIRYWEECREYNDAAMSSLAEKMRGSTPAEGTLPK